MRNTYISMGVISIVVLAALIYGFTIVGSPFSRQAIKADQTRMSNFSSLKSGIQSYYLKEQRLPDNLTSLSQTYSKILDPQTGKAYVYERVSDTGFKLCATFSTDSKDDKTAKTSSYDYYDYDYYDTQNNTHKKGYDCITYSIPESYIKKVTVPPIYETSYNTTINSIQNVTSSTKPVVKLSYDGDVLKWDNNLTDKSYGASQISFIDSKGAQIMGYNSKGITTYRPYFSNWKTAEIKMFIDGYYQTISNKVTNTNFKDCDSSKTSGICYR